MTLCVNSYMVQNATGENTDTVMTNSLCASTCDITYRERILYVYSHRGTANMGITISTYRKTTSTLELCSSFHTNQS